MNEELQNFIVKITTEGFADLKTTLDKTNKMLDDLDKNFDKSKKSGNSFFDALVKWTGLVGGLTLAFQTLKSTIRGVFDTAYDVVDLYKQEQLLGVEAKVLERYGIVAQRNLGSQNDAYTFFNDVNELMGRFRSGKITSDDMYKFTKLGVNFQYKRDASIDPAQELAQNRDRYLQALHSAVSQIDLNRADQVSIMKDLIKPSSMQTLFMANDEQFKKQMDWAENLRVLSKDEKDLQNAQDLITVEMEWKQTVKEFKTQLMPILTEVLVALKPLIPDIKSWISRMGEWVDKNADNLGDYVKQGVEWLTHDFWNFLTDFYDLMKAIVGALEPIVEWVVNRLGGTFKSAWDMGKVMLSDLKGSPDADKQWQEFSSKYLSEGSTAGGYFGDYLRWVAGVPTGSSKSSTVINNGNTYTIKGGTTFTKDTTLGSEGVTGAMLAHFAKANK